MVINTNTSALSSARLLGDSQSMLNRSLARLSSGSKLINPSDDAAGAAVSARLDAQVNRTQAASDNVGNAISFSQTQDGYLKKVAKALDRMSELSMLALDETKSDTDRGLYNTEFQNLGTFITKTAQRDFNGVSMFAGANIGVSISSEADSFSYTGVNLSSGASYSAATSSSITTTGNATTALSKVKDAITQLAKDRATVGANQTALNMYSEQLGVSKDNLIAANSRIKDVNVADESTNFARFNILVQAGTAMLAQANATPQSSGPVMGFSTPEKSGTHRVRQKRRARGAAISPQS
jgi:flagellin